MDMAHQQTRQASAIDKVDPVWTRIRGEAEEVTRREPELTTFMYENILHHDRLEDAIVHRVAQRLDHADVSADLIRQAYHDALEDQPRLGEALPPDIFAPVDRAPATQRFCEPVLYYKGFHAIQTHRLAHWLLSKGRKDFAMYLQSRASVVFQCDINPAARIGRGIFLDHATGLVVGETAVIDDDVSILHDVTLGGTGKEHEDRHPKIRRGGMIGGGEKIPRKHGERPRRALARGFGGDQAGSAQRDGCRRSRQGGRRGGLSRAVARDGPDALRRDARRVSALWRR